MVLAATVEEATAPTALALVPFLQELLTVEVEEAAAERLVLLLQVGAEALVSSPLPLVS